MAAHHMNGSLRRPSEQTESGGFWIYDHKKNDGSYIHLRRQRPGKTAEDKRIGAWKPKHMRGKMGDPEYRASLTAAGKTTGKSTGKKK